VLHRPVAILATAALTATLAAAAVARPAVTPKLTGTVGPGYTISLKSHGKKVNTLKPGSYAFVVSDKAAIHSFVLERQSGGKFEKTLTGVGFRGTKTVTVKLGKGKWKYYCMPHESVMFGFFTVR
jgi:plastocyanin